MLKLALSPSFCMAWPKIQSAVLGNAFQAFDIVKEEPEFSHITRTELRLRRLRSSWSK